MHKTPRNTIWTIIAIVVLIGLSFGGGYYVRGRSSISADAHRQLSINLGKYQQNYSAVAKLAGDRAAIIGELERSRDELIATSKARSAELDNAKLELKKLSDYHNERGEYIARIERDNRELRENLTAARDTILRHAKR